MIEPSWVVVYTAKSLYGTAISDWNSLCYHELYELRRREFKAHLYVVELQPPASKSKLGSFWGSVVGRNWAHPADLYKGNYSSKFNHAFHLCFLLPPACEEIPCAAIAEAGRSIAFWLKTFKIKPSRIILGSSLSRKKDVPAIPLSELRYLSLSLL